MPLRKDIWRVGVVEAPMQALLSPGALAAQAITWLPDEGGLRFLADPFGLWRDGKLHLFAEAYDYRDRKGVIDHLVLDAGFKVVEQRRVLEEAWHLSYPVLIEADGQTYMLPEAHRSGRLTLYRAAEFPNRWEPAASIVLDQVPIDATPVFHAGLWWLFYTPATTRFEKVAALHLAYAERLLGPWTPHPGNPVRIDPSSARPGGTPIIVDGELVLPVQDCARTYGGAIRPLRIHTLTPDRFEASAGEPIAPPPGFSPYSRGLHTMASAGDVTLIDAKRQHWSAATLVLDARRQFDKALKRLR